jgi:hypothetical protein
MTAGFLCACHASTIYDLTQVQRAQLLEMLGVPRAQANALGSSSCRCDCGRLASAVARYSVLMLVGHAATMHDWLCYYCAHDVDDGVKIIWLA